MNSPFYGFIYGLKAIESNFCTNKISRYKHLNRPVEEFPEHVFDSDNVAQLFKIEVSPKIEKELI